MSSSEPQAAPQRFAFASLGEPSMRPWLLAVAAFYVLWAALCFVPDGGRRALAHWPIALTMALGSYVAGSTPMGGGSVSFPVLVLLFGKTAALGRNFALVIQATGMTSATLYILCRRSPIAAPLLRHALVGAALGMLLGTFLVVPRISDALVKLAFACLWASFGVLTLLKNGELCELHDTPAISSRDARGFGLAVGLLGGVATSLMGVGIEMLVYTLLVLLFRVDLKVAVPTAVIAIAMTSVMGALLHLALGDIDAEVYASWLAAAPIVVLGAPVGALLVSVIPRRTTLYVVATLCVLQLVWMLYWLKPTPRQWAFVAAASAVAALGFSALYRLGRARAEARAAMR